MLILQTDKMKRITVINNSSQEIYVGVSASGESGQEGFFTLAAKGGWDSWERNNWQVISFTRSQIPGMLVETVLGVPDKITNIFEPEHVVHHSYSVVQ